MQTAGVKTFICSFVVSLSAIFSADKFFAPVANPSFSQAKIPSKNIVLFLKQHDLSRSAYPSKKIILSQLNKTPKRQTSSEPAKISDLAYVAPLETANLSAEVFEKEKSTSQMPIEVAQLEEKIPLDVSLSLKEELAETPSQSTPLQKPATVLVSKNDGTVKKVVYGPSSNVPAENDTPPNHLNSIELPAEKTEITVAMTTQDDTKLINSDITQDQAPEAASSIIPLEKNNAPLYANAEIKAAESIGNNTVALNAANVPIKSIKKEDKTPKNAVSATQKDDKSWQQMKDIKKASAEQTSDPWAVATRRGASPNKLLPEKKETDQIKDALNKTNATTDAGKPIQLAAETVDNLLIPIPEEILKEENITPQLISSPENAEIKKELEAKGLIVEPKKEEDTAKKEEKNADTTDDANKKSGILESISAIFSSDEKLPEIGDEVSDDNTNSLFSAFSRKKDKIITKILPTEIRLSFQANRAEISGQTLKWIKAFAQKTAEDPSVGLEIRIDGTSSPLLQRRRLNLLQNILFNEGAPAEKIKTTFTAREPNSFILRTIKFNAKDTNLQKQNKNKYIQW